MTLSTFDVYQSNKSEKNQTSNSLFKLAVEFLLNKILAIEISLKPPYLIKSSNKMQALNNTI